MRAILTATMLAASMLFLGAPVCAQTGRSITGTGQTKPPSRDAAPPATSAPLDPAPSGDQKQAEVNEAIRRGQEAQRARDRASDALMERWEFAVCVGCGPSLKPFRRVWTNPLRVLAGIPTLDDDKRNGRLGIRWVSLVVR
jgi:hypothetical protein